MNKVFVCGMISFCWLSGEQSSEKIYIQVNNSCQQQLTVSDVAQHSMVVQEGHALYPAPNRVAGDGHHHAEEESSLMISLFSHRSYMNPLNYSWKTLGICCGVAYAAIVGWLWWQARIIKSKEGWSAWHQEIPIAVLQELEVSKRQELLLNSFKQKYEGYTLKGLEQFAYDIRQEKKRLEKFLTIMRWINCLKIGIFLPRYSALVLDTPLKMQRLDFVYNQMDHWVIKQLHQH